MNCPGFADAVGAILSGARRAIKSKTFILPYDTLVTELVEAHDITPEEANELLFEATMTGDLVPIWTHPDLSKLNFALVPKEGIKQDA